MNQILKESENVVFICKKVEKIKRAFDRYDDDQSGEIDRKEFKQL